MEQKSSEDRKDKLEQIVKEAEAAINEAFVENIVKNNHIEFDYGGIQYRVNKPSFEQRQELFKERGRIYTKFLSNPDYSLESELKKLYKNRGIDIDKIDQEIKELDEKINQQRLVLGKLLKDNAPEQECELLRKEIEQLSLDRQLNFINRTDLLQYSLENQVTIHVYTYLAVLVTEKFIENSWVKAFANIEEFKARNEDTLANRLIMYVSLLMKHELEA